MKRRLYSPNYLGKYLLYFMFFLFLDSCRQSEKLSYSIEENIDIPKIHRFFFDDVDNNQITDIIAIDETNKKLYNERIKIQELISGVNISIKLIDGDINSVRAIDLNNDSKKEIFVSFLINDSLFFKTYDPLNPQLESEKKFIQKITRKKLLWHGSLILEQLHDFNNDGHPDLLFQICAMYDVSPRGAIAYDNFNNKVLWKYFTGSKITDLQLVDINNDGKTEIIFNSNSPCNGTKTEDSDDLHSYFIILNDEGKQIFFKEMAGKESTTFVNFFTGDAHRKPFFLTVTRHRTYDENTENSIIIWDLDENNLPYIRKANYNLSIYANITIVNENPLEFLVVDYENRMFLIDSSLTPKWNFENDERFEGTIKKMDLDHDGSLEYCCPDYDSKILVFNEKPELILEMEDYQNIFEIKQGRDKRKKFYGLTDKTENFDHILAFSKYPAWHDYIPGYKTFGVILIMLSIYSILLISNKSQERFYDNLINNLMLAQIKIDNSGKIIDYSERLLRLNGISLKEQKNGLIIYDQNENRLHVDISKISETGTKIFSPEFSIFFITKKLKLFQKITYICLIPTGNNLENISSKWFEIALRLAHDIKNPLSVLKLSLQDMKFKYPYPEIQSDETFDKALLETDKIKLIVDKLMQLGHIGKKNIEKLDINNLLQNVIDELVFVITNETELKLEKSKDFTMYGNYENLYMAFKNLIENSIQAIEEKGIVKITVSVLEYALKKNGHFFRDYVEIEISDTGCGIPEDVKEKIFEPFFTTKEEGSGLGLILAKQIIEKHDGSLQLKQSINNIGTTFLVSLPINRSRDESVSS